ncbi:MAG: GNAT family N-acetyltransferase [Paramuribaculum sp.]|nr:GNAT family N-acetyltransferase [Paramuribaculum sp.]
MRLIRYTPDMAVVWDSFVTASRNGTFLFKRGYMDYHSDRFTDHSLMAYDGRGRLIALLPASADDNTLSSHAGLTYGGWVTSTEHCGQAVMLDIFDALRNYMSANGFKELIYKPVPPIYHRYPAEDDIYALFRQGAVMDGCMTSATIPLDSPLLISGNNRRDAAKARREGLTVDATTSDATLEEFWTILTQRLREAHDASPVHSLDEMRLLHSRFPDNIRLVAARTPDGKMAGGMLLYIAPPVIHTQYIATTEYGRRYNCNALILTDIYDALTTGRHSPDNTLNIATDTPLRYIDFGTSCQEWGRILNAPLASQKERLGGRTTLYTRYRLSL